MFWEKIKRWSDDWTGAIFCVCMVLLTIAAWICVSYLIIQPNMD